MRLLNNTNVVSVEDLDFSAGYGTKARQDLNWEWNHRFIKPLNEVELVGEFSVNEYVSPEDYRIYQAVNGNIDEFKSVKAYLAHPDGAEFPSPEGSLWRENDIREALEHHRYDYKILRKPKEVPMPIIKHVNPDAINPPIFVTRDWYVKRVEKNIINNAINHRIDREEVMRLMIEKDAIRDKIGMLDRRKPKDAKRILKLNCRILDIDEQIKWLESVVGREGEEIDYGSKFGRTVKRIKNAITRTVTTVKKKVKKAVKKVGDFFSFDKETWHLLGKVGVVALAGTVTKAFSKIAKLIFG